MSGVNFLTIWVFAVLVLVTAAVMAGPAAWLIMRAIEGGRVNAIVTTAFLVLVYLPLAGGLGAWLTVQWSEAVSWP